MKFSFSIKLLFTFFKNWFFDSVEFDMYKSKLFRKFISDKPFLQLLNNSLPYEKNLGGVIPW